MFKVYVDLKFDFFLYKISCMQGNTNHRTHQTCAHKWIGAPNFFVVFSNLCKIYLKIETICDALRIKQTCSL